MKAIGMIEVKGFLTAVESLDSALKAANVTLHSVTKVRGGLVSVIVMGDVGAVKASMDAAAAAAERVGIVLSVHVIPRPSEDVMKMLETQKLILHSKSEKIKKEDSSQTSIKPAVVPEEKQLAQKSVEELRQLARALKMNNMTKNEIKFAKKSELIEAICKFMEGRGD